MASPALFKLFGKLRQMLARMKTKQAQSRVANTNLQELADDCQTAEVDLLHAKAPGQPLAKQHTTRTAPIKTSGIKP